MRESSRIFCRQGALDEAWVASKRSLFVALVEARSGAEAVGLEAGATKDLSDRFDHALAIVRFAS